MKKYSYQITITAEIEAFNEEDAWEAVQDVFGTGDYGNAVVVDCEFALV